LDAEYGIYGTKRQGLNECIGLAIRKSFFKIDEEYYVEREGRSNKCGSTASVVCIVGIHIFCANVGDSRTILSRTGKVVNLSLDHKASRPDEVARIKNNDGKIEFGRVGAKLAITRAFGDFEFKAYVDDEGKIYRKNFITSEPEIRRYDYNPFEDEFILIASDGLFDNFTS
jgi:serine/threonine protein phosphatase PrpC